MPIDIIMPALSPTMTAGTLAKWLKQAGDAIKSGDAIAEIETDKATMEVEATDDGVLDTILVQGGSENVKVGTIIGKLREEGEAKGVTPAAAAPKAAAPAIEATPAPAAVPAPAAKPAESGEVPHESGPRLAASPLARRLATEKGLDWHRLTGSGPHGRIVKADVLAAGPGVAAAPPKIAAPASAATSVAIASAIGKDMAQAMAGGIEYELIPHNNMRRTVARRLTESKQSVPHFYLTVDCEIDRLLQVRKELNEARAELKLSVNDFVIRAAALALGRVPEANSSWSEDGILRWQSIDISVAVAIEGGLITPIVKQADKKGIAAISGEMRDLAARARTGKLKLDEFQGGTFSVSNLGMYGIREFAAIINPPQGCILAVGAGEPRAVVKNGALAVATIMSCTLSVDHRVVDGAAGATFLKEFKSLVENPLTILV